MRSPFPPAFGLLLALGLPGGALGQIVRGHLECYRVADRTGVRGVVDIASSTLGIEHGCRLGRATLFCTPASTSMLRADVTPSPVRGRRLIDPRICYRIVCPQRPLADREVADEFGSRTLRHARPRLLCTAAVHGPPRPTMDHLADLACYQARDPTNVKAKLTVVTPRFGFANGCRLGRGSSSASAPSRPFARRASAGCSPSAGAVSTTTASATRSPARARI